jgi:hypothetical protein
MGRLYKLPPKEPSAEAVQQLGKYAIHALLAKQPEEIEPIAKTNHSYSQEIPKMPNPVIRPGDGGIVFELVDSKPISERLLSWLYIGLIASVILALITPVIGKNFELPILLVLHWTIFFAVVSLLCYAVIVHFSNVRKQN